MSMPKVERGNALNNPPVQPSTVQRSLLEGPTSCRLITDVRHRTSRHAGRWGAERMKFGRGSKPIRGAGIQGPSANGDSRSRAGEVELGITYCILRLEGLRK